MTKPRPTTEQIAAAVSFAERAVTSAAEVRKRYHRRRTPQRDRALEEARTRCEQAAAPLRSWIGMVAWGGISLDDELAMKGATESLRYERRQIAKML